MLGWYFALAAELHRLNFLRREKATKIASSWNEEYVKFRVKLHALGRIKDDLPDDKVKVIQTRIESLKVESGDNDIDQFFKELLELYQSYSESSLNSSRLLLSDTIQKWNADYHSKEAAIGSAFLNAYEEFKKVIDKLPDQKDPISHFDEFKIREMVWAVKQQVDRQKLDALFSQLKEAYGKYSRQSMYGIMNSYLETMHEWRLRPQGNPQAVVWSSKYMKFLTDSKISNMPRGDIPQNDKEALLTEINNFQKNNSREVIEALLNKIHNKYKTYNRESLNTIHRLLHDKNEILQAHEQHCAVELDRKYGSRATIKGTRLGNTIQAYNEYSFERYRMEAEVFWPRLLKVMIDKDYNDAIQNQKITLDFSVTCATLSFTFTFLCIFGPLIFNEVGFWIKLGAIGLFLTFLSYQMAVSAAETLGHQVRSSYDLYRLKLLKSLNLKWPNTTEEEREVWSSYSQFVVFGESRPLDIIDHETRK